MICEERLNCVKKYLSQMIFSFDNATLRVQEKHNNSLFNKNEKYFAKNEIFNIYFNDKNKVIGIQKQNDNIIYGCFCKKRV